MHKTIEDLKLLRFWLIHWFSEILAENNRAQMTNGDQSQ